MKPLNISLLFVILFVQACQSEPSSKASSPASAPLTQWKGYYGGREEFAVVTLRTAPEWDAFWAQVQRAKPQPLDPGREMAVAVFLGQRNTGGYSVEIVRAHPSEQKLVVEYRETTPPPDAMVTQALTTPWTVAIVPRSNLPIEPRKTPGNNRRQRE